LKNKAKAKPGVLPCSMMAHSSQLLFKSLSHLPYVWVRY